MAVVAAARARDCQRCRAMKLEGPDQQRSFGGPVLIVWARHDKLMPPAPKLDMEAQLAPEVAIQSGQNQLRNAARLPDDQVGDLRTDARRQRAPVSCPLKVP